MRVLPKIFLVLFFGGIPVAHAGFFSDLADKISSGSSSEQTAPLTEDEKAHPQAYAYYKSGRKKLDSKDYQGAVAEYTRAIESYPEFTDAYKFRGAARGWLDDDRGWLEDINRAISLNPNNAAYYSDRAKAKGYVNDWVGQVSDLEKALVLDHNNQDYRESLINAKNRLGLYEEEKSHPQAYAYFQSGSKKSQSKDYQGAIAEYTRAIESDPGFADAYKSRGNARGWLDDDKGWLEDLNRAISLNPNNAGYYADRAKAKSFLKDWVGQVADYEKAVALEPYNQTLIAQRDKAKIYLANVAVVGGASFPMILVPGRSYPPGRNYEMGRTEVTQAQWVAVMGENPSHFSKCGDDCPVENVSWEDTKRFIQQLNKKTGKEFRLPTGEEWDYACKVRGGVDYCGGDDLDKLGWTKNDSGGKTHPVADKKPNAWGFYDMTGNVWEWVEDKYDEAHDWRVLRGGSWGNTTPHMYYAISSKPAYRLYSVGFRLARTLP